MNFSLPAIKRTAKLTFNILKWRTKLYWNDFWLSQSILNKNYLRLIRSVLQMIRSWVKGKPIKANRLWRHASDIQNFKCSISIIIRLKSTSLKRSKLRNVSVKFILKFVKLHYQFCLSKATVLIIFLKKNWKWKAFNNGF